MSKLTNKGQSLWDQFGEAFEKHCDTSADYEASKEDRRAAARAYLYASAELYDYIVELEGAARVRPL